MMTESPSKYYAIYNERETDFRWYVVRSKPHQEKSLAEIISRGMEKEKNIIEVFCPINTIVTKRHKGKDVKAPLYSGHVFVLATYNALSNFLRHNAPDRGILFRRLRMDDKDGRKSIPLTVPETEMKVFREFNDSYDECMVVLDRPYSDYAYNPKSGKMNEVVKIMDGPFAGKSGYFVRFGGERRLVFCILDDGGIPSLTVSIPNIWSFHVSRMVNGDMMKKGSPTERDRAIDMMIGTIQTCGLADKAMATLLEIVDFLYEKTSWVELCKWLAKNGKRALSKAFAEYGKEEVSMVYSLMRYEKDNKGYVEAAWSRNFIRPFLTPTAGIIMGEAQEKQLAFPGFDVTIRRVEIEETVFYPHSQKEETVTTTYYAHIGEMPTTEGKMLLFANWDRLLSEYFLTAGKANACLVAGTKAKDARKPTDIKLIESFRNYAPTLYHILHDADSKVKAVENLMVGERSLNVLCIETDECEAESIALARQTLIDICLQLCKEIYTTTHLAVWRRYLEGVWLHL